MTSCPEGAVLAAYLAGERSEVELEEIERHVALQEPIDSSRARP